MMRRRRSAAPDKPLKDTVSTIALMISSDELQIASLVSFSPRPGLFGSTMQGSLPAVHPQGRFAATPIDGAMAWLTAHWPVPVGVLLGPAHATGPAVLNP